MKILVSVCVALALCSLPARSESPVPEADLASLQAAMQSHIEQNLVDGALLHLDVKTGTIQPLYPAKAHPMIMSLGDYYYLCADFRDSEGRDARVNFFAAKDHDRYVIFHTDFDENTELEHLVEKQASLASR